MSATWSRWLVRAAFIIFVIGFILADPNGAAQSVRVTWDGLSRWLGDAADSFMTFLGALLQ